jgi:sulfur-oxidizing protein SoxX
MILAPTWGQYTLSQPLTDQPGNPTAGRDVLRDSSKATCLICHGISSLSDRDQGTLGPSLDGVALRYDQDELRQRIVDARTVSPETIMPPYYSTEGLFRVAEERKNTTIYSAQEVEDVVAFLMTLHN